MSQIVMRRGVLFAWAKRHAVLGLWLTLRVRQRMTENDRTVEIAVTEEMIAAGKRAFYGPLTSWDDASDQQQAAALEAAFLAMLDATPLAKQERPFPSDRLSVPLGEGRN
jgi:hypothetical protein